MKKVKEHLYEKFQDESDPIHDMNIGPQEKVYRCVICGSLVNENGEDLEGEELENAKVILDIFKNKIDRIIPTQCYNCYEYAKEQYREFEKTTTRRRKMEPR